MEEYMQAMSAISLFFTSLVAEAIGVSSHRFPSRLSVLEVRSPSLRKSRGADKPCPGSR